jgi:broad specificity polyphosphatase/5'/3'-nucleotidase SurE
MLVPLANDDGIEARGLHAMREALLEIARELNCG